MRRRFTVDALVVLFAVATLGLGVGARPALADEGKPTDTWGGNGGATVDAQVCTGHFGNINKETGFGTTIHYGGYQQCSPAPMPQALTIKLYRFTNGSYWVEVERVDEYSPSTLLLNAWDHSDLCQSTAQTLYHMRAWGAANGVPMQPYPAYSFSQLVNCYLAD